MQEAIFTDHAPKPRGFYSQAVKAGPLLFISGTLPADTQGQIVGETGAEQATQVLRNIQAILEAAGCGLSQLVQVTIYVSDIGLWPEVNTVYSGFLADVPVRPARAVIPVKELNRGAKIEMQAVAYLP